MEASILPFEFTIQGIPVSLQTRNRARLQAWKAQVNAAAAVDWPAGDQPETGDVRVAITYYYDGQALDVDNMIKPIQDALVGLVIVDDNQVTDTVGRKRDINGTYRIRNVSACIAVSFSSGTDFVHVKVEAAPDPTEIPS